MRAAAIAVSGLVATGAVAGCDALLGIQDHELAAEASSDDAGGDGAQDSTSPVDSATDATLDGPGSCTIGGRVFPSRALDPSNSCVDCQPAVSASSWTFLADGTACGDGGGVCRSGACVSGSDIGGVFTSTFAVDPSNVCLSCQPATSLTEWTPVADGASCSGGTCCAGACVDEQTDKNDCGGCGLVCTATCALGRCLLPIATNLDRPQTVLLNGDEVYWDTHSAEGVLETAGIDGGALRTLASGQDYPGRLSAAPNYIYWSNYTSTGSVVQVSIDAGVIFTLASAQLHPSGLAWTPTGLYWAEQGNGDGGAIRYLPFDGGKAGTIASAQLGPVGVVADTHDVYWANDGVDPGHGSVVRAPLGGGPVMTLAAGLGGAANVALDDSYLYWTEQHEGLVLRVPIAGGTPETLVSSQRGPTGVAVGGGFVYWVNNGGGTLMSYDLVSGAVSTIAAGLSSPSSVAIGETSLYFCENVSPGDVVKVTPK